MDIKDYKEYSNKFDSAQDSTKPFLIMDDSEPIVVGDANDISINSHDFEIEFRVPEYENGKTLYKNMKKEYKGVFISPKKAMLVRPIILEIEPFFRKPNSDGSVSKYTEQEAQGLLDSMGTELVGHIYDLVAAILGIDPALTEWMTVDSVLGAFANILEGYKEFISEGDMLFRNDRS